jgi:sugar/nucleoside kinase (ribokinase family)
MDRRGICTAGNLIADITYHIDRYPARGELTTVLGCKEFSAGGLASNTTLSLAMLDKELPIYVSGRIGDDAEGRFILSRFAEHKNIDTKGVIAGGVTSYTLVLIDRESKERTFFVGCNADSGYDVGDVDFSSIPAKIFHAGYILLMKTLDSEDKEYGTRMALLLHLAQQSGMRTSIDMVSEAGDRFSRLVPPAMKYADYCVINEYEAGKTTGIPLREESGRLLKENMLAALNKMRGFGVSRWAVIHCPEGAYGLNERGEFISLPCLKLPPGFIKGTTGAGDAFAAGVLYGAHEDWPLIDALRLGIASAACSLHGEDSYCGVRPVNEAMKVYRELGGA